jgi:hypothetical protein
VAATVAAAGAAGSKLAISLQLSAVGEPLVARSDAGSEG